MSEGNIINLQEVKAGREYDEKKRTSEKKGVVVEFDFKKRYERDPVALGKQLYRKLNEFLGERNFSKIETKFGILIIKKNSLSSGSSFFSITYEDGAETCVYNEGTVTFIGGENYKLVDLRDRQAKEIVINLLKELI